MALNWNWKEKCGEATLIDEVNGKKRTFTLSLYEGNAFLIMLHEYKDEEGVDMYDMYSFFLDADHAKACLGIKGAGDNIFEREGSYIKSFTFYKAKCRNLSKLIPLLVKGFKNIEINVYTEEI